MLPPLATAGTGAAARAAGDRQAPRRVALFTGCVADVMFRHTHWATARVLQQNGCDVVVPPDQVCCGAIHFHAGSSEPARELADANLRGLRRRRLRRGHRQRGRLRRDAQGLRPSLARRGAAGPRSDLPPRSATSANFSTTWAWCRPSGEIPLVATYHDACHLGHAQKIREAPRRLLAQDSRPRARGFARDRTLLRRGRHVQPDRARDGRPAQPAQAGQHSVDRRRVVITANAGCLLQICREARSRGDTAGRSCIPMDLLDLAYQKKQPRW